MPGMDDDLRALEERWGLAVLSAGFGVWDLDPVRDRVHYSPQWKAMLGYGGPDIPDSTEFWRSKVHPDDLPAMLEALFAHLEGRATQYEAEFRLRGADGAWRHVLSRGRVVERDAGGQAQRMVGTLTDLTDRRQAEALRLERDRTEAAHRARSDFLARMSHELRTPLNAVLGFAQLLGSRADTVGDAESRRYLAGIENAGWQLLAMVDDILDVAKAAAGGLVLATGAIELGPVLDAALDAAAAGARQAGVAIHRDLQGSGVHVHAHRGRLEQVLAAVLSNAIRYNRRGGRVTVGIELAGRRCRIVIADTGRGIPAARLPTLFEPFNGADRIRRRVDGVGVGLPLSRWLTEGMGGQLFLQSTEDGGTTVRVELALADPAAAGGDLPA